MANRKLYTHWFVLKDCWFNCVGKWFEVCVNFSGKANKKMNERKYVLRMLCKHDTSPPEVDPSRPLISTPLLVEQ